MKRALVLASVLMLLSRIESTVRAQCSHQFADPVEHGTPYFGADVAIDGDVLVAGDVGYGASVGQAYVFQRRGNDWVQTARLLASDSAPYRHFGSAVDVEGRIAAVSATGNGGGVYVFELAASGWTETAKLVSSFPPSGWFGWSLALSESVLVIGDPGSGTATIFERVHGQWREAALFQDIPGFGNGVAADKNTVLVGPAFARGGARVFQRGPGGWIEENPIVGAPESTGLLGESIAISGDRAILGDHAAPVHTYAGRAHIFRRGGPDWVHEAKLAVTAETSGDWFGWSVDIEGTRAVVGAWPFRLGGNRAYVFELESGAWVETAMLTARDHPQAGQFGRGVSLSAGQVAVGPAAPSPGVYLFDDFGSAAAIEYCVTEPWSDGTPRITHIGSLRIYESSFALQAHQCKPAKAGVFFYGNARTQIPWQSSVLCVAPGLGIHRFPATQTDSAGSASHHIDFMAPPAGSGPGQIVPGSTWYFQFAFHDAGTLALTEGMRVTFCP